MFSFLLTFIRFAYGSMSILDRFWLPTFEKLRKSVISVAATAMTASVATQQKKHAAQQTSIKT